jgi:hypothetical protein
LPMSSLPATKWRVKSGENIAYTHSLIARTISTNISAITRSQNISNMSTPNIP